MTETGRKSEQYLRLCCIWPVRKPHDGARDKLRLCSRLNRLLLESETTLDFDQMSRVADPE